jgi:hypothetical protein
MKQSDKGTMDTRKPYSENTITAQNTPDILLSNISKTEVKSKVSYAAENKMHTPDGKNINCYEILALRSILEKIAGVNHEDFTWTWDHETNTFLIQAQNNVIQQYVIILTYELGAALRLHLEHVSINVDLQPWKKNLDKTSLRIGFEGSPIPVELRGHTGLEDLIKLHFISRPDDPPEITQALKDFNLMCGRIDSILERKFEWMWERHWTPNGLAFAVVRTSEWMNIYRLVEKEIERFNNSETGKQAGLRIELSTYNRGTSFNVRIAPDGLPDNLRKDTRVLDVFDAHFAASIK